MFKQYKQMAVFAKVIEKGSFTAAADVLGMTKSMVSQHVSRLEKKIGVRLLNRTTRHLALTEEGMLFHEGCVRMIKEAEAVINRSLHVQTNPSGLLRVTAPNGPASTLVPLIAKFREINPLVEIDLLLEDTKLNLVEHQIDVAIQYGWLKDSSMYATLLGQFRQVVCCSTNYLKKHEIPQTPEDLVNHQWVIYNILQSPGRWTFRHRLGQQITITVQGSITTNTLEALNLFVSEGMGFGVFPDFNVAQQLKENKLVKVLPDYHLPEGGIYAIYPSKQQLPRKVRAFIDFLKKEVSG